MEEIKHAEFYRKLDTIPKKVLIDFLISLTSPCYESELLKSAFNLDTITDLDALSLYQNHFVLFHFLYTLQDEFYRENKYLHVHFMRTFLSSYPGELKCRFYEEHSGTFCNAQTLDSNGYYCDFHQQKVGDSEVELLSTKYFYYDINNYYKLDEKTAEDFMNGSWELLAHYNDIKESFKILDLPESAGLPLIKQRFKELAKVYHPDISKDNHIKFNQINNAYRLLKKTITLNNPFK